MSLPAAAPKAGKHRDSGPVRASHIMRYGARRLAGGLRLWARGRAKALILFVVRAIPPSLPRSIGVYEVLLYPSNGTLEWMRRHALVIAELERFRAGAKPAPLTVLDFGGGGGALASALRFYGRDRHYRLILADIDRAAIEAAPVGDGLLTAAIILEPDGVVPLSDGSVDVAVSCDVFEHIPEVHRARWAAELRRVSRMGQVHTFPADSRDGRWASTATDRELDAWHRERYGIPERWTNEHLATAEPLVEDMAAIFEPCEVSAFANVEIWGEMLRDQLGATGWASRLRFGARYLISLRVRDRQPPFKGCLLVTRSPSG